MHASSHCPPRPLKFEHIAHPEPNTISSCPHACQSSVALAYVTCNNCGDARHVIIGHQVVTVHVQLLMMQTLHIHFWPTNDFCS